MITYHHPNCRPQPVSLGHLCHHFHFAESDGLPPFGRKTCTAYWVDDVSRSLVGADRTFIDTFGGAGTICSHVEHVIVNHLISAQASVLRGQRRHNVKAFSIRVSVPRVFCGPLKGTTSEATTLYLVAPNICVDRLEVVFHDQAILSGYQCAPNAMGWSKITSWLVTPEYAI